MAKFSPFSRSNEMDRHAASLIEVAPEVAKAISDGKPVVAIESVVISPPGLYPSNLALYEEIAKTLRASGVVPALVAVMDGRILIGLDSLQLARLAREKALTKVGKREIAMVIVNGGVAATTVSATLFSAYLSGIRIAMTGAIGGVHRGYEETLDVSSDLEELGRTPVAVVCTGAKIILDLARTLEFLETKSVPVIGFRVGTFPAYFCPSTLTVEKIDDASKVAAIMDVHWSLGLETGIVVAVPPPSGISHALIEAQVSNALVTARQEKISGKALTPYLLKQLDTGTAGETGRTGREAILQVAKAAAEIAVTYAARQEFPAGSADSTPPSGESIQ